MNRLKSDRLDRAAWIAAARRTLIEGGVARVKVAPLADLLGVTTGSFYWHFDNREALLSALLEDWEVTNSAAMFAAVAAAGDDPRAQLDAVAEIWIEEVDYDPRYDAAIRDWARIAPEVEASVRRVDNRRIDLLRKIFRDSGHSSDQAFIRARITYFHQVGYYAMQVIESKDQRRRLKPGYLAALLGDPPA